MRCLELDYNIQVELSNYYGVLLICTIGNDRADFEALENALRRHIVINYKNDK